MNLLAYPALLATAISIVGLSRIGHKEHATHGPRPLSELAGRY